jgi:hypothetical protein
MVFKNICDNIFIIVLKGIVEGGVRNLIEGVVVGCEDLKAKSVPVALRIAHEIVRYLRLHPGTKVVVIKSEGISM